MAGSFFALFDDIATILDDVATMTKVAAQKTAGVLGDDLALNAQQVHGVNAHRELPVVWAVAKGSFKNKLILVPAALLISYIANWAIVPCLMLGGAYLCFEGFEKIVHSFLPSAKHSSQPNAKQEQTHEHELIEAIHHVEVDMLVFEQDKIKGAIRTDFILSAEIIVIALGTVASATFMQQIIVVTSIATLMTVGVYGLVAAIVKLDDVGLYYMQKTGSSFYSQVQRAIGVKLLGIAPYLMRALSVIGTAAMFMVGGGILAHGVDFLHLNIEHAAQTFSVIPLIGSVLAVIVPVLLNALVGVVVGASVLGIVKLVQLFKSQPL